MFQPPPIQSPVPSCTLTPVSESFSLAKTLTGCHFLDFYKFAELLSRIEPQEIQGKESLVQRIKFEMTQGSSNERSSQIAQSIDHAIFNQAIDPITGAARELVSNAIDAHARSGRYNSPIYVYVRDHRLEIQDSGDGFDWESVFHYCVLGRSKSRGLSSQERYKNISGTFGQGGYTPFYYLLFDRNGALPRFKMNTNGLWELDIPYQFLEKNGVYRFTFLASTQLPQTHTVSIQDIPQLPKKFIIHTKREESIQMIFSQQQQHLIFDIKDGSKSTVGSHFYLQSPIIEEEKERIINYLKVAFAYIEGSPIFLNNEQINAPTSSQSLVLEEGTLYFNPQLSLHGRLLIYEKGRLICEESPHGNVLESIAINFKQLNLTVERASIDFKDPHILVFLQKLLPAIADHPSYSPVMKAALFNSLYPLIASHQTELIPLIKQWRSSLVLNQIELILPDVFEDDSNKIFRAIYLHPSYCGALSLQSIEAGRGRRLYVLPEESSCHPVFAKTIHGVLHVFIRSDILSHQDAKFNLFLLNLWLEQKFNAKHCIDVSTVLHQIQPSDQKTPLSPASEDMFFQFDLIPQSDDEFVTLDLLIKENGIEEYSKMTDFTFFQNFYRQPQFANLFPKIWLLGKKQALEQEMLQENEESKVKRDQLEWFARFIQSSPIRYSFLCEQNFFHFSDLHRVCLDATDLPLDRFCEVVQTVFNYLDNCTKFENKPIACLEAKRYLNFLIHTISLSESLDKSSSGQYISTLYVRFRTIAFSTHLTDAEAKIFQETEEYFGDKDYKRIEELIQKIPTVQAKHIAITLYHDLYPHLNVLLSLSPTQLEQLLLLLAPHDLPFQDNIKNLYNQRLDYKRGIRANDCALLIQHILPLTNWSLTAKKALAECYFLLVLIKEEQFDFLDPNKQVTIYESLFFETVIPYVRHLSHSSVLTILDQTHASLSQILEFHGERNTLIGLLRNCSNAQGIENLFQEKRKEMQWLNSYQNSQEFYQSIKEFHDFFSQLSEVENPLQFNLLAAQRQSKEILLWQKLNLLQPLAKPLVHAAFIGNYASLKDNFAFPSFCWDSALPLHKDSEVIEHIGSDSLAQIWIQGALKQSLNEDFCLEALIENSIQARSTAIRCKSHLDDPDYLTISIEDNGIGIGEEGFKALKTPQRSANQSDTKRFGSGFFLAFKHFEEAIVISVSQSEPHKKRALFLKKDSNSELFIQPIQETTGRFEAGTTILLRKKSQNPFVDFILSRSRLANSCGFIRPDLYVQGEKINMDPEAHAKAAVSISYQGKDRQKKTLHAFLGPQEGLFLERLRINSIPENAWDIVPKRIRKKLEEDHLSVSLFLPPMDQVMDRGHVSNQQDILPILQYAVLKLCFDYYLKKLSGGQTEKQFSNDYWDDFRVFNHMQGHQSIIQSWEGFWQFQKKVQAKLKSGQSIQKQALIAAANQFLLDKPVKLPYDNKTPSELIKAIQEQDAKMENKDRMYAMQKILDENFIPILVEIPLAESPHCFLSIRSTLLEKLKAKLLLTNDNTYNLSFIQHVPLANLSKLVQESIQETKNTLALFHEIDPLLDRFRDAIINRLISMKFQQIELTRNIPPPFFNPLTNFLEDCGKHFLNKNISFFVYSSMNGTSAYTYPQTSNFYLNTVGDISLSFRAFMDRHRSLNPDAFDCSSDQDLAAIMAFLEVLAHECTHMDESRKDPRGCQGTHDQVFRDKMSGLLTKFFITSGQRQTVLEKLKGHLCAGHLGRDENAISAS